MGQPDDAGIGLVSYHGCTAAAIAGPTFPLGHLFSDLAGVLDEQPRRGAERAVLQGDDSDRRGGQWQPDRQDFEFRMPGGKRNPDVEKIVRNRPVATGSSAPEAWRRPQTREDSQARFDRSRSLPFCRAGLSSRVRGRRHASGADEPACHWTISHDFFDIRIALFHPASGTQSLACQTAIGLCVDRNHHPEEPHAQPHGAAVHRARPRGC